MSITLILTVLVLIAKFVIFLGIAVIIWLFIRALFRVSTSGISAPAHSKTVIPVINIHEPIGNKGRSISVSFVRKIFHPFIKDRTKENTPAIVLSIDSPGGSPAQSDQIARYLRHEADKLGIPLLVFGEDVMASGAYYIAVAADRIYCLPSTVVGSIGVRGGGLGFKGLIDKIGVDARFYSSGRATMKTAGSPFLEESPKFRDMVVSICDDIHDDFAGYVRKMRGSKISSGFIYDNAMVWSGREAVENGLVDEIGRLYEVLERDYPTAEIKRLETKMSKLENFIGVSLANCLQSLGISFENKIEVR